MLRHRVDRRDERQVDLRLLRGRELGLGLLGLLVEALEGHLVLREVDALGLLELGHEPVDDRLVEVVAAEVVVTRGGLDLEDAVADLEHGHVERAAAEVEDEDRLVGLLLVEPVGQRGRGRLVDDALDVEAGDLAGVLGRLALVVVEVRGDGDHRAVDAVAEIGLGVCLQLLEDHRADLRRGVLLAAGLDARVTVRARNDLERDDLLLLLDLRLLAPHEALDGEDRVLRVGHCLALRGRAHEPLSALREGNHRGGRTGTLGVLDHGGLAALEDGHARVGRAKIDADRLAHPFRSPLPLAVERNLSASMADRRNRAQSRWCAPSEPIPATWQPLGFRSHARSTAHAPGPARRDRGARAARPAAMTRTRGPAARPIRPSRRALPPRPTRTPRPRPRPT